MRALRLGNVARYLGSGLMHSLEKSLADCRGYAKSEAACSSAMSRAGAQYLNSDAAALEKKELR